MAEFVPVGKASEVAERELMGFEVDGEQVAVACVEGEYYAFQDTCTHRGCSLSEGELDGTTVICPCHGGEFDVATGEVIGGPPPESIATYAVRVRGGDIEIGV